MKIPTLADTIVSNKGRYYGAGGWARLHLRSAQIAVRLGQALAGNARPHCIMKSSPGHAQNKTATPNGVAVFGIYDTI